MKAHLSALLSVIVFIAALMVIGLGETPDVAAKPQPIAPPSPGLEPAQVDTATVADGSNGNVSKTVTPTGAVMLGGELTYTLLISAAPGVQIGLYDPLTDTTFMRFVELPTTGAITHTDSAITGTLTVTPTGQVTVSFVVQVGSPGTLGWARQITNRACVYPFGWTLGGCIWSNEVSNAIPRLVYLPLIVRGYAPIRADFTAFPMSGMAPLTTVFTNTSTGNYTASVWHFGDGITSAYPSPTHTYTAVGAYTVTLTVSGAEGSDTLTRTNCITVSSPHPCTDVIANGSFEHDTDWEFPLTAHPAAYTTATARSGNRSARVGITGTGDNRESYSSVRQTVAIPADTISATLRFWLYPLSGAQSARPALPAHPLAATIQEAALASDVQYVLVLDAYERWINTLVWQRTNEQQWTAHQFDLTVYTGRTIKLQFGVYNDGWDGATVMYVDDVSLEVCTPGAETAPLPGGPAN
jgi:PKD repeat protein